MDRTVRVAFEADYANFVRGTDRVSTGLRKVGEESDRASKKVSDGAVKQERAVDRLSKHAARNEEAWNRSGQALTAFGAITTATVGATVKAAVDWESAWTGVLKTVDGTPEQLAEVEDGLRELARSLPATHTEIAAVAEAAGQLGISTGGVVDFTQTMVNLGETTNLSADEAATSLARLSNIMGTSESDIDNIGASVVGLGNNFATTESEIVAMSLRLAGAGRQAGMTEGDVLGLATAMSSVGIEAEAGGTAMSQTMTQIGREVDTQGPKLETFAAVAGMTAEEFTTAWGQDASGALAAFITGLDDTSSLGMSTNEVLEQLGITGIRQADTLRRLSAAQDLVNEALATGNEEYSANNALVEEAAKRYETTEAQLEIAKGAISDAAITVGETFLPMLASGAEAVADLASGFASLPEPAQQTVGVLGGVAGAASLVAGGFLLVAPRVFDTVDGFRKLRASAPRTSRAIGRVGRAAGVAGAALAALQVSSALVDIDTTSASEWTEALLGMSDASDAANLSLQGVSDFDYSDQLYSIGDAIDRIDNPTGWQSFVDGFNSLTGFESNAELLKGELEGIGQALATMYDSSPDLAAENFAAILAQTDLTADELLEKMPAYRDVLLDTDNAHQLAAQGAEGVAEGLGEIDPAAEEAAAAAEEFVERATDAFTAFIDPGGAYQAAIDKSRELAEKTAEDTEDAEDSWEDYYDGHSVSSKEYIAQLQEQVEAQENWRTNMITLSERVNEGMTGEMRDAGNNMIEELMDLGPEGAAQVALLESMSDEELAKVVELYQRKGEDAAQELADEIANTNPPAIAVTVETRSALSAISSVHAALNTLNGREVSAYVETKVYGQGRLAAGGLVGFASGGRVPGTPPADPMADNVYAETQNGTPYLIRSGEWIHNQAAVEYYGTDVMSALNQRRVPKDVLVGFAAGGQVPGLASGGPVSAPVATAPSVTMPTPNIAVYLGDRQITDIVSVEVRNQQLDGAGEVVL